MAEEFVQSLARGLQVITAFNSDRPRMSLSEVAVATGLSRASARRFLHTLVELGYVRTDGKQFELTPHVLRLGTAYLSGLGLPQLAQPHLERLSAEVGESTSAAVLDGTEIVYVARVSTRRIMTVGITVGTRFPAFATSMGRVLLAYQRRRRARRLLPDRRSPAADPADGAHRGRAATAAGRGRRPGLGRGGSRSWRSACSRWPLRSATSTGRWWPRSTCRPPEVTGPPRSETACWPRPRRSAPTWRAPPCADPPGAEAAVRRTQPRLGLTNGATRRSAARAGWILRTIRR